MQVTANYLCSFANYLSNVSKPVKVLGCACGIALISQAFASSSPRAVRWSLGLVGTALVALFLRKGSQPAQLQAPQNQRRLAPESIRDKALQVNRRDIQWLLIAMQGNAIYNETLFLDWLDQLKLFCLRLNLFSQIDGTQHRVSTLDLLCSMVENSYEGGEEVPLLTRIIGLAYSREVQRIINIRTPGFNFLAAFDELPYPANCPDHIAMMIFERTRSFEILARLRKPPEIRMAEKVCQLQPEITFVGFYGVLTVTLAAEKAAAQGELQRVLRALAGPNRDAMLARAITLIDQMPRNQPQRSHRLEGCSAIVLSELLQKVAPHAAIALIQDNNLNIDEELACPITLTLYQEPMKTNCCNQGIDRPSWRLINNCCPFCRARGATIRPDQRMQTILGLARNVGLIRS